MFFKPASYSVPEGEFLQIVLQSNNHFDVPFTINVTIMEGAAVGKCVVHILHNTQYTAGKALVIIRIRLYIASGKEAPICTHAYACTILLVLDDK